MRIAFRESGVWNLLSVYKAGRATGKRKDAGDERRGEAGASYLEPAGLPLVPRRVIYRCSCVRVRIGRDIGDATLGAAGSLTPVRQLCLPGVGGLVRTAAATTATPGALTLLEQARNTLFSHLSARLHLRIAELRKKMHRTHNSLKLDDICNTCYPKKEADVHFSQTQTHILMKNSASQMRITQGL